MFQRFQAAVVLHRRQREQRRLRECLRQRIQMRKFNATLRAVAVPDAEPFVKTSPRQTLEGGQASIVETAGT
jgi:hypothetical protein